jgi:hypothetical protein
MSYLNLPRLTFAGLFEADVNTVNNDVRNYDVSTFEPRFQTPQTPDPDGRGTIYNGWWNPNGSNAFRLLDCAATGGVGPDGWTPQDDPALKLRINAQFARTAAKIVDLDPQFQFASAIWGLRIVLTADGETVAMSASFVPTCFRDIYFGRVIDKATGRSVPGSPSASARFTGALEDIAWGPEVAASPLLSALKASADANGGRLSMSLMTYGYSKAPVDQGFTFGTVVGTIGTWKQGDPLTFAPGRRFAPSAQGASASPSGLGFMNGALSEDGGTLSLDFGNSLPMWQVQDNGPGAAPSGHRIIFQDLGPLRVVVLKKADEVLTNDSGLAMIASTSDGDTLDPAQYEVVGTVEGYDIDWLRTTGGIADLAIPEAARALIGDHPIAVLVGDGKGGEIVAIRETVGGVWVRADDFIQRVDAAESGWVPSTVTLYAMRFGKPLPNAFIEMSLMAEVDGAGGAYADEVKPPQTDIPPINIPPEAVSLPAFVMADANGVATLSYAVADPGNPRGYIDGQIYQFAYSLSAAGQSPMPGFEQIVVHVRDAFVPSATPSWETDIAPVLVQYGNLYPVMSRGLFSFADYNAVTANARILYLAFTRPIEDPNYMPATRDMSAGKLRMIVDWLAGFLTEVPSNYGALPVPPEGSELANPAMPKIASANHPARPPRRGAGAMVKALGPGSDIKAR